MLLPFAELLKWIDKRQKHLGWTNKVLAEKSKVPEGTLYRIKAGEEDCKFSTMRNILIALFGGTTDEFACTEQVENELKHLEALEAQAAKLSAVEAENERLIARFRQIDEQHRQDIRAVKEEYQEQIAFLKEQLRAWQAR
jgi:predicted transcriptional regulator